MQMISVKTILLYIILSSLTLPHTSLHLLKIKILPPGSQLGNQRAIIPPQ